MPRGSLIKAELLNQPFMMCPAKMETYMNVLNEEVPRVQDKIGIANNNVVYTINSNVAIIAIDGAMYKKSFNGACGESVVSYPDIIAAIDKAEADTYVDTILFRVDTGGGSVAGAEEVRYRIKNSSKKTVTFYENIGASGGLWIFTASDELYAAPITWLGSIGVVVAYEKQDGESKRIELVSKNARNKRCKTDGDCEQKMQEMIDTLENDFFAVLNENTGFSQEDLVQIFENGGIIKAEIAKEKGFIQDVRQFSVLLSNLKSTVGVGTMPDVQVTDDKIIGGMAFNEDNFHVLVESRDKSKATILDLNTQLAEANKGMESSGAEMVAFKETIKTRVALAVSYDIRDAGVISNIICADSEAEATKCVLDAKTSNVTVVSNDGGQSKEVNEKQEKELAAMLAKQFSI